MPKNMEDLGKLIVAKGFKKLPKVQKIAKSGHTGCGTIKDAHFSIATTRVFPVASVPLRPNSKTTPVTVLPS